MIDREALREWYSSIGRLGGAAKSEWKMRAARRNGRKGGRPKRHIQHLHELLKDEGLAHLLGAQGLVTGRNGSTGVQRGVAARCWGSGSNGTSHAGWTVGWRGSESPEEPITKPLADILETDVPAKYSLTPEEIDGLLHRARERSNRLPPQVARALREAAGTGKPSKLEGVVCVKGASIGRRPENGPQYGEFLLDGSCYTLNTTEVHGVAFRDGEGKLVLRRLTPLECERLMGLPEGHSRIGWNGSAPESPDRLRYGTVGNAMCVPVVRSIAERIGRAEGRRALRYLSLFSGIGSATVAFEPLGWRCLAFAEVAKFPSAVLRSRWSRIPNAGDATQFDWSEYHGKCDLMVGGSPCQAFSTAGLRRSLWDERGGLMLRLAEAIHAAAPGWAIAENVPGLLETDDNAFGEFLGGLAGAGAPLRPPHDGWRWPTSGIVAGPAYGAAWRVLDAQFFGVPQRRRRVFVVAHRGDWRPAAAALFEIQKAGGSVRE